MGRAIVRNPKVFLFDEPLSNLDAKLRVQMRTEIRALHLRLKTTTVYVTHDQIEAMTMADRIVVMRDGNISQAGAPLDLYDRPANTFVAGFIGSPAMNLIEGVGQGASVTAGPLSLPAQGAAEGRPIVYGIRPEHLSLGGDAPGLDAVVKVVEPTGSETHLVAEAGGREVVAVSRDRTGVRPGDRIRLRADPIRAHLFDAATGEQQGTRHAQGDRQPAGPGRALCATGHGARGPSGCLRHQLPGRQHRPSHRPRRASAHGQPQG
jgi:multiple sugar transport system ATP-binding protein